MAPPATPPYIRSLSYIGSNYAYTRPNKKKKTKKPKTKTKSEEISNELNAGKRKGKKYLCVQKIKMESELESTHGLLETSEIQ